ncbi:hypothetical protein FOCC_FOCC004301 [Frankliniella occidentalis]|nr:hypothetical protein FOCC_FOCC004301 [Frankliniella occidentalis]
MKERYPSLALQSSDEELCRQLLLSYQGLLMSKDLCEGRCPMGQPCPTGLCRSPSKRTVRRKSSTQSLGGGRSTPPTSPRMLPATPTGPPGTGRPSSGGTQGGLVRSGSSISYRHRPSVSSAPPSRSSSRTDLPNTLVRTGSALDHHGGWMSSSGPGAGPMSGSRRSVGQGSQGTLPTGSTASPNRGSPTSSPSKTAMLSRTPSRDSVRDPVRRKLPNQPVTNTPTAIAVSHATPVCSTAAALAASSPCSSSMVSLASLRSISEVASDDETPLQKRRSSVSRPRTNSAHAHGAPHGGLHGPLHGASHTTTQGGMTTTQQSVLNQNTHQVVHQTTVRATRTGIITTSK